MQENFRCPGCEATMEYYPQTGKMYCPYCGITMTVEEMKAAQYNAVAEKAIDLDPWDKMMGHPDEDGYLMPSDDVRLVKRFKENKWRNATMKMQILHCRSCGAEMVMNEMESASFCAYCGQPAIVLDRVDECLEPDRMIPFKVSKTDAEAVMKKKLRPTKSFFVPKKLKDLEVDRIIGIYVPYWMFDVYYGDDQYWKYTFQENRETLVRYSHRIGDCEYSNIGIDGSTKFCDALSQRLEPYFFDEAVAFDPRYLSGFYADRFDLDGDRGEQLAMDLAKEKFDEAMKETLEYQEATLCYTNSTHYVKKREYVLLPAWFFVFGHEGKFYNVLMNGQTGKMVGALPYDKKKAYLTFGVLTALLSAILAPALAMVLNLILSIDLHWILKVLPVGLTFAGCFALWLMVVRKYEKLQDQMVMITSLETKEYATERQER